MAAAAREEAETMLMSADQVHALFFDLAYAGGVYNCMYI